MKSKKLYWRFSDWWQGFRITPRCKLGIHYYQLYTHYHGYYDPPELEYGCPECGKDGFPFRIQLQIWLLDNRFVTPFVDAYFMWKYRNEDDNDAE